MVIAIRLRVPPCITSRASVCGTGVGAPVPCIASENTAPPASEYRLVAADGTDIWPLLPSPQATILPSSVSARLCEAPAAMATRLVVFGGTLVGPELLLPQ